METYERILYEGDFLTAAMALRLKGIGADILTRIYEYIPDIWDTVTPDHFDVDDVNYHGIYTFDDEDNPSWLLVEILDKYGPKFNYVCYKLRNWNPTPTINDNRCTDCKGTGIYQYRYDGYDSDRNPRWSVENCHCLDLNYICAPMTIAIKGTRLYLERDWYSELDDDFLFEDDIVWKSDPESQRLSELAMQHYE